MADMGTAFLAHDFCAYHAMAGIPIFQNHLCIRWLEKTGPATACIKFRVRQEQRLATTAAVVYAFFRCVPLLAGKRAFSTFLAAYVKFLGGELVAPILVVFHSGLPR